MVRDSQDSCTPDIATISC